MITQKGGFVNREIKIILSLSRNFNRRRGFEKIRSALQCKIGRFCVKKEPIFRILLIKSKKCDMIKTVNLRTVIYEKGACDF